jgi:hypothetical protein
MQSSTPNLASGPSVVIGTCLLGLAGCGKPYRVAEVEGTLSIHSHPANKVQIQFFPDSSKSTVGPSSTGETDAKGHFVMVVNDGNSASETLGAVVGWHQVGFTDLGRGTSENGTPAPPRFGPEYMQPATSPISKEVKDEKQTIDIQLP